MSEIVVLVVDQDEKTRLETADLVRQNVPNSSVLTADSVATAEDALVNQSVDVVVTGYSLEDGNGLELAERVRETNPATGCILYTHSETVVTESFEDVVVEFVGKETPSATQTLTALIEQAGTELTQTAHPVPESEPERLDATELALPVADELSTPLERVTTLALEHFGATGSAITLLMRERQVPIAEAGSELAPSLREESFATHTLVEDSNSMAVEDTRTDPRFTDTDSVQSAGIVSYLGAPITVDGLAVGVLSVYDDSGRTFSAEDRAYIEELASLVSDLFALWGRKR